ncbi:dihydrofolate reductase family protein [Candidatus Pacearchaeota archaeon]|nr:dihydrofolate reductase family protein [Candidatus Pacearchaeota archaeon]
MRKIILFMVMSLDGYVCGPNGELDWEIRDEEIGRYLIKDFLTTVDSMIMGRVLFEGFHQAWPAMAKDPKSPPDLVEFAHWVENSPKIVFSRSTKTLGWKNSRLITAKDDAEVIREIRKLKSEHGKDMIIFGGARMSQTLVRLGLIDEYRLKVQPIVLGSGQPLFKDIKDRRYLKLIKSKIFDSGVVALYYQPIKK